METPQIISFADSPREAESGSDGSGEVEADTKPASWMPEIVISSLDTIVFIALMIGFYVVDGRSADIWERRIAPNAALSVLTTLMGTGHVYVLSSCLGQMKWISFKRSSHSLHHMQMFDDASRRSIGGLLVPFSGRGGLMSLITIVMFLTFFVSPCVQQVLTYPSIQVPENDGSLVYRYVSYSEWIGQEDPYAATMPMKGAVYDALYSYFADDKTKDPYFMCSSGDCDYPNFITLGICSTCQDMTDDIEIRNSSASVVPKDDGPVATLSTLPQNNGLGQMNVTCQIPRPVFGTNPITQPIVQFTMLNISAFSSGAGVLRDASAWECQSSYCLQKHFDNRSKWVLLKPDRRQTSSGDNRNHYGWRH